MKSCRRWTAFELDLLRRFHRDGWPIQRLAKLLCRSETAVEQVARKAGLRRPNAGRFRPGRVPFNKGRKGWQAGGRSRETQFRPGNAIHSTVPLGTEVVDRYGYLKRKVRDDARPGESRFNWVFVHVLNWAAVHGPVPAGHCLAFRDGDKRNVGVDNLELITRRERMRRNTVHNYPPEIVEVIMLRGRVNRQINKRRKRDHEEQD